MCNAGVFIQGGGGENQPGHGWTRPGRSSGVPVDEVNTEKRLGTELKA